MPFGSDRSVPAIACTRPPGCHSNKRPVISPGRTSALLTSESRMRVATEAAVVETDHGVVVTVLREHHAAGPRQRR